MDTITFNSRQFSWQGQHGVAELSDLLITTKTWNIPNMFYVKSSRNGAEVLFTLDTQSPGYEDGWDGEYKAFTNHDRTLKITILND